MDRDWGQVTRIREALFVFGGIAAATVILGFIQGSWDWLIPDPCRLQDCFCEPFQASLALQPINTYSNLALVWVGLLAGWTGSGGQFPARFTLNTNPMTRQRACPAVYGATLTAAGLGSLFYHTSLSRAGEWTDLVGIYLFIGFLLFYNLSRLVRLRAAILAAAYSLTMLFLGIQMAIAPELQHIAFGGLTCGALGLEGVQYITRRPRIQARLLVLALAFFAAGAALWALDGTLLPCSPAAPIQWHAAWHLLSAGAAGFLYLYYLSEQSTW